mgnify:CR=1 FL=1
MKKEIVDWIYVIAAIIAIAAGIALLFIGLCEETPWRILIIDVVILATSVLVMKLTSNGMNFSIDVEDIY